MLCTGGPGLVEHYDFCKCSESSRLTLHGSGNYTCLMDQKVLRVCHMPVFDDKVARRDKWVVHSPCACNHMNALLKRVNRCVPPPSVESIDIWLVPLAKKLADLVGRHPRISYPDIYGKYGALKRARYQRAEVNLNRQGGLVYRHQAKVKMFVKLEGIKFSDAKINPDCRAIQFRSFEYCLRLGSAIKRAEHALYKAVGDGHLFPKTPFIAKNLNPRQRAALLWEKFIGLPGCWILELDASRFDAHVSYEILQRVEHLFWKLVCLDPDIEKLLDMQLINHGGFRVREFFQRYKLRGGRMSGDANTAAGNCIIMSVLLAAFGKHLGVKFDFLCDGDDSVFFYQGVQVTDEQVWDFFQQFGFSMKIEGRPKEFVELNFCQSKPVFIGDSWTLIRDPYKIMSKIGVSHKLRNKQGRNKYIRTVALGELSLCRGCPMLQDFLVQVIKECERGMSARQKRRGMINQQAIRDNWRLSQWLPKDWTKVKVTPITSHARNTFSRAWGVPVHHQLSVEKRVANWSFASDEDYNGLGVDVKRWIYPYDRRELW